MRAKGLAAGSGGSQPDLKNLGGDDGTALTFGGDSGWANMLPRSSFACMDAERNKEFRV